jgi:hypothetical protein
MAAALLLNGCASAPDATESPTDDAAASGTAAKGCAVLAGGGIGSAFADPAVTRFWYQINKQITDRLHELLRAGRYRAVKLIVPVEQARNNERRVLQGLARHRCGRLIQLSHAVNEDASGKFFRFDVAVMQLVPKGSRSGGAEAVTVGEFSREYRYPRTSAAFDAFQTGEFAAIVFTDLERSGALEPLR